MTKEEAKKFLRENGFCETHGVKLSHRTENGYWGERRIIYCPLCELADAVVRRKREEAIDKQAEQARRVLGGCTLHETIMARSVAVASRRRSARAAAQTSTSLSPDPRCR